MRHRVPLQLAGTPQLAIFLVCFVPLPCAAVRPRGPSGANAPSRQFDTAGLKGGVDREESESIYTSAWRSHEYMWIRSCVNSRIRKKCFIDEVRARQCPVRSVQPEAPGSCFQQLWSQVENCALPPCWGRLRGSQFIYQIHPNTSKYLFQPALSGNGWNSKRNASVHGLHNLEQSGTIKFPIARLLGGYLGNPSMAAVYSGHQLPSLRNVFWNSTGIAGNNTPTWRPDIVESTNVLELLALSDCLLPSYPGNKIRVPDLCWSNALG